jgi:hypothetical protein
MAEMSASRIYEYCGLRIRSCVELPASAASGGGEPDVEIRCERLPVPGVLRDSAVAGYRVEGDTLYLAIRDVGIFGARRGREILVDAQGGVDEKDLSLYLIGSVLGAILHQRGVLPLHASAVEVNGGAVAFAGPSGAGKSTVAAFLSRRGYPVIADDVCALAQQGDRAAVWPGVARLKLGREGLQALARSAEGLSHAGGTRDKFQLPVSSFADPARPVPLSMVYVLTDDAGDVWTQRVEGLEAIEAVASQTYCREFVESMGLERVWFHRVARVANGVEIRRLMRPRGFQHMERVLDRLEREWQAR